MNYFARDRLNIFELSSQLSLGVDALGGTINNEGSPDGRFAAWKNEAKYIRILNPETNTYFQLRGILQVAKDSLPGFDAFSLGGLNTVRGYRQNQVFSDNALFLSAELAVPLYRSRNNDVLLQLTPFVDYGKGWNTNLANPEISELLSTGLGLRFSWRDLLFVTVDYGIPLLTSSRRRSRGIPTDPKIRRCSFWFTDSPSPSRFSPTEPEGKSPQT